MISQNLYFVIVIYNIHGLIDYVLNTYILVYSDKEIIFPRNLNASNPVIAVDRNHFVNVMTNLLDNARKYAKNNHVNMYLYT
jgi:two-component system, OmpR family, phosphate regulon sensor histidine kinase PhoR